ncbi:MAG TPA: cysteine desulfurase family protein [Bacteroidia bacterium]|nr:cysteine desulfurase family protein [Bacteroidia bacterium]
MRVYLDNAATTPLDPEVLEAMLPVLKNGFGNPSSIHAFGREVKTALESSRKTVARILHAAPSEIFFTSGGTEADNTAIVCSVRDLGIRHIITSRIEHHAVLHTVEELEKEGKIKLSFVNLDEKGNVNLAHLEELLRTNERSLVSLMHANNELGNVLPLKEVGALCKQYDALFHSDTVQTMGHFPIHLPELNVHFITCAAHKFHGPKGVGFLYISNTVKIHPFIFGGAQERNMRGGTENVYGIVGLAKALELATSHMDAHKEHILGLKKYMIEKLVEAIPGIQFNGDSASDESLYTVLNVAFPPSESSEMLLFNLDIAGIACSGGSACSSGSNAGSHVLKAIYGEVDRPSVRFSFSKYNTKEEIDFVVDKLKELYSVKVS